MRLPYAPRAGQDALVAAIERTHLQHGHLIAEAGTGTGKTVCALAGTLGDADAVPVVYATRTNAQQEQVLQEHRVLRDAGEDVGLAIPFMGRRHYCPMLRGDERFREGTAEELGRLCRDAKRKALQAHATGNEVRGACPFYRRLVADGTGPVEALLESHAGDAGALAARIAAAGSCPYEALKMLIPQARLVIVPNVFLIDDRLRMALLEWMGASPDQVRVVLDEAHHLPEAIRAHHSPRLGLVTVERAMKEAEELDDPALAGRSLATSVLATLHGLIRDLAREHAPDSDDGWIPADAVSEALMVRLQAPGPVLDRMASELEDWGEALRERRRAEGRLPRSHLGAVGSFMRFWNAARDAPYVHLVTREPRPALEAYLLDPAPKARWLQDFSSTVQLSGTIAPLDQHARLLGLDGCAKRLAQPSPFDPERLRIFGVLGARRRYRAVHDDPGLVAQQQDMARCLVSRWTGRMGLFFPSHQMMQEYLEAGFLHGVDASLHAEAAGMATPELMALLARFRGDGARRVVLLGVLGGRLTEGIDYPGDLLQHLIVMGVPYPRPSARSDALIAHFDRTGDSGWRVAVHDPTGRTLRQAIGRLIRGPDDEGTAVVLDERIVRFRDHIPRLRVVPDVEGVTDMPTPQREGFHLAAGL